MVVNTIAAALEPQCASCGHGTLAHNAIGGACTQCECGRFRAVDVEPDDDQCPSVSSWGTVCTVGKAAHEADPRIAHSDSNGEQWFRGPLDQMLAEGHTITYEPDPVWAGSWFADLRDPDGYLAECGNGATQAEALADLARRVGGAR